MPGSRRVREGGGRRPEGLGEMWWGILRPTLLLMIKRENGSRLMTFSASTN